ncbi:MAG: DJ-1/PfpI family protein [Planctomycetes bacterium]|nr:DJ-1/PfpI family protein [Planctomycetota bacterium]
MSSRKNIDRRGFLAAGAVAAAGLAAPAAAESRKAAPRGGRLEGKRVLIATGEFGEGLETYYMIFRLREEGAIPVVGSKTVKRIQLVVHDFEPAYEGYTEKLGYQVDVDIAYKSADPESFDGLLIPGGRAPEEIRLDKDLVKIVGHFLDKKLPVGAMCHGVMLIYTARPIKGRKMTAYYGIRPDIELLGGEFLDQEVVVDGSLVTSRGWPDLAGFMREYVKLLAR